MEIVIANKSHVSYAAAICENMAASAKVRGTGIARRSPQYIISKMEKGQAVIALDGNKLAGFCYMEIWGNGKFIANSGLIVIPKYRGRGLAGEIKTFIFKYSLKRYPNSKFFGITTGLAVMRINYDLGYTPVTFSELTDDEEFWKGCQTCKNYDILTRTDRKMCLCTGMLYDPEKHKKNRKLNEKMLTKLRKMKQRLLFKGRSKKAKLTQHP